ncbi:MAG: ribosome small subunit-dependent GTPase A [Thiolinea sp.]
MALLGSSGVGKSTLTNTLRGDMLQATAAIREQDSKGRHTTTSRSLHRLQGGGILLDTPGMRELQMVDCEQGIQATFADIEQLAEQCRFHDCQHDSEPGCAVTEAVAQGRLEQRRLDNYHKLMVEQARNSESLAEKRQQERALGRFYKQAKASAQRFKSRD